MDSEAEPAVDLVGEPAVVLVGEPEADLEEVGSI